MWSPTEEKYLLIDPNGAYFDGWKSYKKLKKARAVAFSILDASLGKGRTRTIQIEAESLGKVVGEVFVDSVSDKVMYRQVMRLDDDPHELDKCGEYILEENGAIGGLIRKV